eukprot:7198728-Ditylum_brightwellii.AAC.1
MPPNHPMMLIGVDAPRIYFNKSINSIENEADRILLGTTMKDFDGLKNKGPFEMAVLMNFSYYLTEGNIDKAYKAVHMIKTPLFGKTWPTYVL